MKYFLMLTLSLLSIGLMAQSIQPAPLTEMKDSDKFFPLLDNALILNFADEDIVSKFNSILKDKGDEIIKLKTEDLSVFKISVGQNLKYLNFNTGELGHYKFGKDVYIRRITNEFRSEQDKTDNYYKGFQVLLIDDIAKIKAQLQKKDLSNETLNGIVYTGSEIKLRPSKMSSVLKRIPLPHPSLQGVIEEIKKNNAGFDVSEAYEAKIGDRNFYRLVGSKKHPGSWVQGGSTLLLKKDSKFLSFKEFADEDYATFHGDFKSGPIFEGVETVLLREGDKMHSCATLIIVGKEKIEELRLRCDSGGC